MAARDRRRLGAFAVIAGWFAAAAVIFSFSSGIIHTYYLSALAPATAALVGAGVVALWRDARAGGRRLALPVAALALCGWLEVALLRRSGYDSWLQGVVVVGTVAAVAGLVARRRLETVAMGVAVVALFAAPAVWSSTVFKNANNGTFPGAGPNYLSGASSVGGAPGGVGFGARRAGGPPTLGQGAAAEAVRAARRVAGAEASRLPAAAVRACRG